MEINNESNRDDDFSIDIVGSSDYCYTKNNNEYYIKIQNYTFPNPEGYAAIISNYFIISDDSFCLFASIVWEDIKYINDDYDPYNYDPDPVMVIYRDDLPTETEEKYLTIIHHLCHKYYKPTTHFKHFNPELPKVKLSEFSDKSREYIKDNLKELLDHYTL